MIGEKFGRLTVLKKSTRSDSGRNTYWLCECSCGEVKSIRASSLKHGRTKSCGCYKKDFHTKHGHYGTRLYNIWQSMKKRCYSTGKNAEKWSNYKEKKIIICDEWLNNFENFKNWAYENGYKDNLSIERVNNNGNYEPSNCIWATPKEQSLNRSSNRLVTINGVSKTITQWADEIGINRSTVNSRVNVLGWDVVDSLTTPSRRKSKASHSIAAT